MSLPERAHGYSTRNSAAPHKKIMHIDAHFQR